MIGQRLLHIPLYFLLERQQLLVDGRLKPRISQLTICVIEFGAIALLERRGLICDFSLQVFLNVLDILSKDALEVIIDLFAVRLTLPIDFIKDNLAVLIQLPEDLIGELERVALNLFADTSFHNFKLFGHITNGCVVSSAHI